MGKDSKIYMFIGDKTIMLLRGGQNNRMDVLFTEDKIKMFTKTFGVIVIIQSLSMIGSIKSVWFAKLQKNIGVNLKMDINQGLE